MILAIDTSGPVCSAAFLDSGSSEIIAHRSDDIGRGHAELLLPMIDQLMEAHNLKWDDVEAVGCSTGPGSFTGLRVGLAAAKGIAFARSCPCIGVSVFEAFAYGFNHPICVVMNAKRDEFWLQNFNGADAEPTEAMAIPTTQVLNFIPLHVDQLAGSGSLDVLAQDQRFNVLTDAPSPPITAVAQLANERLPDPDQFPAKPLYLRAPDAKPQAGLVLAN